MQWKNQLQKLHVVNLLFAIFAYIFIVILDRTYLVKRHDKDIEWEKSMQGYPDWVEEFFNVITSYFNTIVFPILLIFYCYSPDKKFFVLAIVILGLKAFYKSFWALIYREERPFMIDEYFSKQKCFCVFGNPSGHVSNTFAFYLVFIYYIIWKRNINIIIKIIIAILYLIFIFLLCWSRLYFYSHFLNQVLFGLVLGYLFFSIFYFLYNLDIMTNMFNEQNTTWKLRPNIKNSEIVKFEQQKLIDKIKRKNKIELEQPNVSLIQSDSRNQKIKSIFTFTVLGVLIVSFIIVLIIQQVYIHKFEKADDNYLSKTQCGLRCKKKGEETGEYISYDGFASTTPNQFYIGIIVLLWFKKKPVRIKNNKYVKQSFWPLHRFLIRLICHVISFLPIIAIYILVVKEGLTLMTYLVSIAILIVQFFFSTKLHIWLLILFRCQIAGDLFYIPDQKFIMQEESPQYIEFTQINQLSKGQIHILHNIEFLIKLISSFIFVYQVISLLIDFILSSFDKIHKWRFTSFFIIFILSTIQLVTTKCIFNIVLFNIDLLVIFSFKIIRSKTLILTYSIYFFLCIVLFLFRCLCRKSSFYNFSFFLFFLFLRLKCFFFFVNFKIINNQ